MALKTGSVGTMLQGVSQQPDRVRLEGQVTQQVNMISDVTEGLTTRPATRDISVLENGTVDMKFSDISVDNSNYLIGYKPGEIALWDNSGVFIGSSTNDYIGQSMRFYSLEGKLVCLNRDAVVNKSTLSEVRSWRTCLIYALGGQFSKTYKATIRFSGGFEISASYTTPDGTGNGDAAQSNSDYIIQQLANGLQNDPNAPFATSFVVVGDVLLVHHTYRTMKVTLEDGEAGEVLRGFTSELKDVADLPRFAPNGAVVKVSPTSASADDFWLKYEASDTITEDGLVGFGKEGVWKESLNPYEDFEFDLSTMPHEVLVDTGDVQTIDWFPRRIGDEDSAPFPSFLGTSIRDISGFEGRLVLLSKGSLVMSRTNKPFDLWIETATGVTDTDRIDITSTIDKNLDWVVPFDRDLFLFSDPGKAQFVVRGGGVTPENISMVLASEFEVVSGGAKPVSTGRTILMPFTAGVYSGVKEFYTDADISVNAANTLTESQPRYIVGEIRNIQVSQNFNTAVFTTGGRELFVYKYLWDGTELLQSSWSKWEFSEEVLHCFFDNNLFYLVSKSTDNVPVFHSLDLHREYGPYGFHIMLDRMTKQVVDGAGTVRVSFPGARFLQGTGCANPGVEATALSVTRVSSTEYEYTFSNSVAPTGADLYVGQGVDWSLKPSQVFAKDYQDRVDVGKVVTIQDYIVHLKNSGEVTAKGTSPYSEDWYFSELTFPMDNEPTFNIDGLLFTGTMFVPWGERADWSELELKGNDIRPVTLLELEWSGQIIHKRGKRA